MISFINEDCISLGVFYKIISIMWYPRQMTVVNSVLVYQAPSEACDKKPKGKITVENTYGFKYLSVFSYLW